MAKKATQYLKYTAFVALGLFLAWLSLRNIPREVLWDNFSAVNPAWMLFALAVGMLSHLIRALRWNMLLEPAGYRVKPLNAFMAVMAGYFINLALPRTGEIARCGLVAKYDKVPVNVGVGTVVAERAIDMLILLILFGVNLLIGFQNLKTFVTESFWIPLTEKISPTLLIVGGITFVLLSSGVLFFVFKRKKKAAPEKKGFLQGFIDGLKSVLTLKNPIRFILSSLSIWLCYYLMLLIGFQALPATAGLSLAACLSVFVFGTVGMIVTPGGIGAYPALVGQTLMIYGIQEQAGISFGWIIWGAQTLLFIILGPLSLLGFPLYNSTSKSDAL